MNDAAQKRFLRARDKFRKVEDPHTLRLAAWCNGFLGVGVLISFFVGWEWGLGPWVILAGVVSYLCLCCVVVYALTYLEVRRWRTLTSLVAVPKRPDALRSNWQRVLHCLMARDGQLLDRLWRRRLRVFFTSEGDLDDSLLLAVLVVLGRGDTEWSWTEALLAVSAGGHDRSLLREQMEKRLVGDIRLSVCQDLFVKGQRVRVEEGGQLVELLDRYAQHGRDLEPFFLLSCQHAVGLAAVRGALECYENMARYEGGVELCSHACRQVLDRRGELLTLAAVSVGVERVLGSF